MSNAIHLADLLSPWLPSLELGDVLVQQLSLDSRRLGCGVTFVAIRGHAVDGRDFIDQAIASGVNAVVAEADDVHPHGEVMWHGDVPVVYVAQLPQYLSQLAGRLYQQGQMSLIGVTGTNGKTTITQLIAQWIELLGQRAAVMGTTGNGFLNALQEAANTTGNAIEVQRTLSELADQGADFTALEVSSHGLVQGRVKALDFAAGVFTNLSRDHLDYHQTMDAYADAKFMLFGAHACQHAIINADDPVGLAWMAKLPQACAVSLQPEADFSRSVYARSVAYSEQGITIEFAGSYGADSLHAPLIGQFNASNLLLALATLLSLGFDKDALIATAGQLEPVLGRMELFQNPGHAKVVVDYAHTPDALEKALQALRIHCQGRLWVLFGCGGDRDTGKRPMMAAIAETLADQVILCDDNPRSEDPALIVADMLAGMLQPERAVVEHERFAALQYALSQASEDDIILLAGKGHEDYQVLKHETVHYSDREAAQQLLGLSV